MDLFQSQALAENPRYYRHAILSNGSFFENTQPSLNGGNHAPEANPDHDWIREAVPQFYGKTLVHVSPGIKPTPEFLAVFPESQQKRVLVANAHQSGGLEPLVGEELVQITEMGMNAIGTTLLYEQAPMQQADGSIVLEPVDYSEAIRHGKLRKLGTLDVPIEGKAERMEVWAAEFTAAKGKSAIELFFKHPFATVIYPADQEIRMRQMILLGRGTLAVIRAIHNGDPQFAWLKRQLPFHTIEPAIVQMNEALSVFAHPGAIDDEFAKDPALRRIVYGFTTHTPVASGLQTLPVYWRERIRLNERFAKLITEDGQLNLTKLALLLSDVTNAVSKEHAIVTVRDLFPAFKKTITGIVNGIYLPHWQLREFGALVGRRQTSKHIQTMILLHEKAKARLRDFLYRKTGVLVSPDAFISVEARRKTEFKSADTFIAAMRIPELRDQFLKTEIVQVFAGKPHIQDRWGLARVRELQALMDGRVIHVDENNNFQETDVIQDETARADLQSRLKGRVLFVPNLNVWEAEVFFQGADVLDMWSELGTEASATGYMKGLANGIPAIATKTGGPLEHVRDGKNGFFIQEYGMRNRPTPKGLIAALVRTHDLYAARNTNEDDTNGHISDWHKMKWNALQTTPKVDVRFTLQHYLSKLWAPAYRVMGDVGRNLDRYIEVGAAEPKRADVFLRPGVRQRLEGYLSGVSLPVPTNNEWIRAHVYETSGKRFLVLVNIGDNLKRGQHLTGEVWANESFRRLLPRGTKKFRVRNAVTHDMYNGYDLSLNGGLHLPVELAAEGVQVLLLEPADPLRLPNQTLQPLLANQNPAFATYQTVVQLLRDPQPGQVVRWLGSTFDRDHAQRHFGEKGVRVLSAIVALYFPERLGELKHWDLDTEWLEAIQKTPSNRIFFLMEYFRTIVASQNTQLLTVDDRQAIADFLVQLRRESHDGLYVLLNQPEATVIGVHEDGQYLELSFDRMTTSWLPNQKQWVEVWPSADMESFLAEKNQLEASFIPGDLAFPGPVAPAEDGSLPYRYNSKRVADVLKHGYHHGTPSPGIQFLQLIFPPPPPALQNRGGLPTAA